MIWASGEKYDGDWKNDMQEGKGTYLYASGTHYEGEWRNGVMEGKGTMIWTSGVHKGDRYIGEFTNDLL